jgi:flavodoxin
MKSIVLFATRHGNTRRVAETIGVALERYGTVQVLSLVDAGAPPDDTDLVLIGGPTEAHGLTPEVDEYFTRLPAGCLVDVMAAAFDTRLNWPHFVSGSAANAIARRLEMAGAEVLRPQGSFLVTMAPELRPGELARASDWGLDIGERAAATVARRHVATASGSAAAGVTRGGAS